ncbi:MAG: hypothetical protein R3C11_11130 [Planctomycetaceae bacterium]
MIVIYGHDERHWFIAQLPDDRPNSTVVEAMEALKPDVVLHEQRQKGVKLKRNRRKNGLCSSGEWFFLPRPKMRAGDSAERNGKLSRKGGKPHRVEWILKTQGVVRHSCGAVSHPDHETIYLPVWHRVVQNNEPQPAVSQKRISTSLLFID